MALKKRVELYHLRLMTLIGPPWMQVNCLPPTTDLPFRWKATLPLPPSSPYYPLPFSHTPHFQTIAPEFLLMRAILLPWPPCWKKICPRLQVLMHEITGGMGWQSRSDCAKWRENNATNQTFGGKMIPFPSFRTALADVSYENRQSLSL